MPEALQTFLFVGVSPEQSASNRLFPRWAELFGRPDVVMRPVPVPLGAPERKLRRVVDRMLADDGCVGALVTTHKVSLLRSGREAFVDLTPDARWSGEASAVRRRADGLEGHATDPTASLLALDEFITPETWRRQPAELACLGTGGSALAFLGGLARRGMAGGAVPRRVLLVGRRRDSLDAVRSCLTNAVDGDLLPFELVELLTEDPPVVADAVGSLPERSLVVNATGLGKDRPGTPVGDDVVYPKGAAVWDFNYRGDLTFLHQAMAQREPRSMRLADGWSYFVHGWFEVLSFVFRQPPTAELRAAFSRVADAAAIDRPFRHLDAA